MSIKARHSNKIIVALVIGLFCYLGLYTWNARTGYLDTIAEQSGLEAVGFVLKPVAWVKDLTVSWWHNYFALVGVAEENIRLREDLKLARARGTLADEERKELTRLRHLLKLPQLRQSSGFAARVIANRFGPHSALHTITTNKGFIEGATVGTPVVVPGAVVGSVLRSSPHTSTVLLLTDPGFRLAVLSQESRTPCIAVGSGSSENLLHINYVPQTAKLKVGELLITAGVGESFPKGIPVAIVTSIEPGQENLFQKVNASPVISSRELEEVLMLKPEKFGQALLPPLMGPPEPLSLLLPDLPKLPQVQSFIQ